ncbi:DNA methyltransferase [Bacillus tianshenii]|nr:DNA methyltransferase [Bacillus tianshenii]
MRIENVTLKKLQNTTWNPNTMEKDIYHSLVESIRRYGVLQPILVRNDMTIIKGEKRWRAAKEAGLKEITCVIVETTDEEAKLLNISLSHLRGQTNEEMLSALLEELTAHFSLDEISVQTGYQKDELDQLLNGLETDTEIEEPVEEDEFDVQEALDEIQEAETQYGDVWKLGRHLLVCGDATKLSDVKQLMRGDKANLIVTDPPYNVAVESESKELNSSGRGKIQNDDMSDEEFNDFLKAVFENYKSIMDTKAAIYVFHGSSYQREFENNMNAASITVRTQCIWVKNAASYGWAQYRFQHEPVFYAHLKGKSPAWYGDRKQTTVWKSGLQVENPEPATVWEVSRGDVTKYVHPTQKPLELLAIPIGNSSKKGDIVIDFFGGSGSTLMTCEQMNRICRTMELDLVFCDVIKKRFYEMTGEEPVLIHRKQAA